MNYEYSDGVLITVTKLSVKRWTLLTLNGQSWLRTVAEGEGPPISFQPVGEGHVMDGGK